MLTDTAIRKWTPTSNDERKRCGDGLYIRGFRSGRKLFQIRASINGKRKWIDLGEYPARKLADAREAALAAKRTLKLGETSAENLQAALLRGAEPAELATESNRGAETSAGRLGVPTFDQAFRDWYGLQIKAYNTHRALYARPRCTSCVNSLKSMSNGAPVCPSRHSGGTARSGCCTAC